MCLVIPPTINGETICNFVIVIHRLINIHIDSQPESTLYAEISVICEGSSPSGKTRVNLSKLAATNWSALDYRISFNPRIATSTANRYIANQCQQLKED